MAGGSGRGGGCPVDTVPQGGRAGKLLQREERAGSAGGVEGGEGVQGVYWRELREGREGNGSIADRWCDHLEGSLRQGNNLFLGCGQEFTYWQFLGQDNAMPEHCCSKLIRSVLKHGRTT